MFFRHQLGHAADARRVGIFLAAGFSIARSNKSSSTGREAGRAVHRVTTHIHDIRRERLPPGHSFSFSQARAGRHGGVESRGQ